MGDRRMTYEYIKAQCGGVRDKPELCVWGWGGAANMTMYGKIWRMEIQGPSQSTKEFLYKLD